MWCVFEFFVTLTLGRAKETGSLLDVGSIIPKGNCESSDGTFNERCAGLFLDDTDLGDNDVDVSDHPETKDGESAAWFPTAVSKLGYYVDLRNAQASLPSDKENILRFIGDKEEEVHATLRKKFARPYLYQLATDVSDCDELIKVVESGVLGTVKEAAAVADEDGCLCDACEYIVGYPGFGRNGRPADGSFDLVKYLLKMGCDPNKWNTDGECTAIAKCFMGGHYDKARYLLEHGADLKAKGPDGEPGISKEHVKVKNVPDDLKVKLVEAGIIKGEEDEEGEDDD